jgi:hypothetical protein
LKRQNNPRIMATATTCVSTLDPVTNAWATATPSLAYWLEAKSGRPMRRDPKSNLVRLNVGQPIVFSAGHQDEALLETPRPLIDASDNRRLAFRAGQPALTLEPPSAVVAAWSTFVPRLADGTLQDSFTLSLPSGTHVIGYDATKDLVMLVWPTDGRAIRLKIRNLSREARGRVKALAAMVPTSAGLLDESQTLACVVPPELHALASCLQTTKGIPAALQPSPDMTAAISRVRAGQLNPKGSCWAGMSDLPSLTQRVAGEIDRANAAQVQTLFAQQRAITASVHGLEKDIGSHNIKLQALVARRAAAEANAAQIAVRTARARSEQASLARDVSSRQASLAADAAKLKATQADIQREEARLGVHSS